MNEWGKCRARWRSLGISDTPPDHEQWTRARTCACTLSTGHGDYHECLCGGRVWPFEMHDPDGDEFLQWERTEP